MSPSSTCASPDPAFNLMRLSAKYNRPLGYEHTHGAVVLEGLKGKVYPVWLAPSVRMLVVDIRIVRVRMDKLFVPVPVAVWIRW